MYYVLRYRIPCNQEWLGRVVQYHQDPTAYYTPAKALELTTFSEVIISEDFDFQIDINATKDETFDSRFSRLLSFENSVVREGKMDLKVPSIKQRSLTNYKQAFERLKLDYEVMKDRNNMLPVG